MKLKENMAKLLNEQINAEIFSAYLYLDYSNYFEDKGLNGFANWYMIQAKEEMSHAMMFYDYVHGNDGKVVLEAIDKPEGKYKDDMDVLKAALKHEEYVTGLINKMVKAAREADDLRTEHFLAWFVNEQAEEETTAKDLITKYELFATDGKGLYALNEELAGRQFTPPENE
ncbi:MAG: ferritin [Clostridiales bacterium]|nr:ferritin [Clostridiales bacterium]MDY4060373.1 ferritin [Anaerovoracaceae bacterium]